MPPVLSSGCDMGSTEGSPSCGGRDRLRFDRGRCLHPVRRALALMHESCVLLMMGGCLGDDDNAGRHYFHLAHVVAGVRVLQGLDLGLTENENDELKHKYRRGDRVMYREFLDNISAILQNDDQHRDMQKKSAHRKNVPKILYRSTSRNSQLISRRPEMMSSDDDVLLAIREKILVAWNKWKAENEHRHKGDEGGGEEGGGEEGGGEEGGGEEGDAEDADGFGGCTGFSRRMSFKKDLLNSSTR
eukprot:764594-Hanusia_phi.AAC.1